MLSLVQNKNIKIILNYVLGPVVFILLAFSIFRQIQQQPNWRNSLSQLWKGSTGSSAWLLLFAFLAMFINWGCEARKWQLALRNLQALSFIQSLKAIFTGTTLASFTPNRTGEYVGRILYVDEGKRLQAIPVTIICSIAQLQVTLYAGLLSIISLQRMPTVFFSSQKSMLFIYCILKFYSIIS